MGLWRTIISTVVLMAVAMGLAKPAFAKERIATTPHPHAYGILVGANQGGSSQAALRYAEDDARRLEHVLLELGHYGSTQLNVLASPSPTDVLRAVDELTVPLREHAKRGEQTVLIFYYSGHANANAFRLGHQELALGTLRDKLRALPTTMTLVVLDACQSGHFSRAKGVAPASDFSFNSVARLRTKGMAVMASSSGTELSQESDALGGSYFTHHLVSALRGAADTDGDGRVSLDEAYRYAYRHTLFSTAKTRIGPQHVTLDTDMAGQGDVPLTYPSAATSHLELPEALEGAVLVQHASSGNIVAEVQKARGQLLQLALTAGEYEVLLRGVFWDQRRRFARCRIQLGEHRHLPLRTTACEPLSERDSSLNSGGALASYSKSSAAASDPSVPSRLPPGGADEPSTVHSSAAPGGSEALTSAPSSNGSSETSGRDSDGASSPAEGSSALPRQRFSAEASLGELYTTIGNIDARLVGFGYHRDDKSSQRRVEVAFAYEVIPHISVGARASNLATETYKRTSETRPSAGVDEFTWNSLGFLGFVRATVPLGGRAPFFRLDAFVQGGVGAARVSSKLKHAATGSSARAPAQNDWFEALYAADAGFELVFPRAHFGLVAKGGLDYAPTTALALTGEQQDLAGWHVEPLGLRAHF